MTFQQSLEPAIAALRNGDRAAAHALLLQVTGADASRAEGWLWLAAASVDASEKRAHLQRAFALDPYDGRIIAGLRALGEDVHMPAPAPALEPNVPANKDEQAMPAMPQSESATTFLNQPRFTTTGVRAKRPIPWMLIALIFMVALLLPITLWLI